jgi:S-(hydroxymethyl)glutathione dehydrogenase/alcohol dehydrogenase
VTVVGIGGKSKIVEFNTLELYWFARTLRGCVYGSSDPDVDVPRLVDLVRDGRLDLAALTTGSTDLAGVNDAFDTLGQGGRTIIRFD